MEHNHKLVLEKVRQEMPKDETLCDLSDLFKIFGDTTRIKILYSLLEEDLCVFEIVELLGMNQSAISHQLKTLKDAHLVSNKRVGKTIIYYLADDHVKKIISQGFEHLTEKEDKHEKSI